MPWWNIELSLISRKNSVDLLLRVRPQNGNGADLINWENFIKRLKCNRKSACTSVPVSTNNPFFTSN